LVPRTREREDFQLLTRKYSHLWTRRKPAALKVGKEEGFKWCGEGLLFNAGRVKESESYSEDEGGMLESD